MNGTEYFRIGTEYFKNGTELFINSSFFKNGTEIVYGQIFKSCQIVQKIKKKNTLPNQKPNKSAPII